MLFNGRTFMRTLKEITDAVCSKFPKANPKAVDAIIKEYQKAQCKSLIDNGHIYITPEIKLEIIPITPRRYVLRGKEYKSIRLYKLKATIVDDNFYKQLSSEYDQFRDDIEV